MVHFIVEADTNLSDIVTKFKYPTGTTYVSASASAGIMNASGSVWSVPAVTAGDAETIDITIEITDLERFNLSDKTVRGETLTSPGEVVVSNNLVYKVA